MNALNDTTVIILCSLYSMDTSDTVVTIDTGAQGDSADVDGVEGTDRLGAKASMYWSPLFAALN